MQFTRLILVVALSTAFSGLFGATVGGLLGYAVPSSLKVFFGVGSDELSKDKSFAREGEPAKGTAATISVQPDRSIPMQGAAVGGAFGLILGVGIGVLLGIIDQIVLSLRETRKNTQPSA